MNLWISEEALYDIEEARSYYFGTSVENLERRFREQHQIHYLYEDDKVMLMGVFHGKSDPQSWEDRIIK